MTRARLGVGACLLAAIALVAFAPGAGAGNGADGVTYVLTAFDGQSLLGLNDQGRTFDAALAASTTFRKAQPDKYQPGDPCREAAVSYNGIQSYDGYASVLAAMVSGSCKAKVALDTRALPPDPIKSFQPVG